MAMLGGHALFLGPQDIQLGVNESLKVRREGGMGKEGRRGGVQSIHWIDRATWSLVIGIPYI